MDVIKKLERVHGRVGWVAKKKLSEIEVLREDLVEEETKLHILGEFSDLGQIPEVIQQNPEETNVALIEDFVLTKEAKIKQNMESESEKYKTFLNWAEENEVSMMAVVQNEEAFPLATYRQRNQLINALYNEVMKKYYKGICIDFEEINDWNGFYRLLIEMTPKFRESGLKVMVKEKDSMDLERLKKVVDFTI